MEEKISRKTDRRTMYTRMVIKDALLTLLERMGFAEITVAGLCREAEINRGTFYLHYNGIDQVVEELLDDALANSHSVLQQIGCGISAGGKCGYPFCRFLRENKKYQALFFSDSLRPYVLRRVADISKDRLADRLKEESGCSEKVLQALYHFQINGCLSICKHYVDASDEEWAEIQQAVDHFLRTGFQNL